MFACKQKYNATDVKKNKYNAADVKRRNTMLDVGHYTEHLHVSILTEVACWMCFIVHRSS